MVSVWAKPEPAEANLHYEITLGVCLSLLLLSQGIQRLFIHTMIEWGDRGKVGVYVCTVNAVNTVDAYTDRYTHRDIPTYNSHPPPSLTDNYYSHSRSTTHVAIAATLVLAAASPEFDLIILAVSPGSSHSARSPAIPRQIRFRPTITDHDDRRRCQSCNTDECCVALVACTPCPIPSSTHPRHAEPKPRLAWPSTTARHVTRQVVRR